MNLETLIGHRLVVRPSSLPSWQDCARRTASVLFRPLLAAAGFEVRDRLPHIGACVGGGVHAGAAYTLQTKLDTGEIGNQTEAEQRGLEEFKERVSEGGCVWDKATRNANTAEKQIVRMTRSYRSKVAPKITPVLVEKRLEADLGDGFTLSGQLDSLAQEDHRLRDLKTGTSQRANGVQYGAYALLFRTHGHRVDQIGEDFVPRVSIDKPQPDPAFTAIPADVAEWEAREAIADMKRGVSEFIRRASQGGARPEMAFRANPSSVLCGDTFCPARGSTFCRIHKEEKK